MYKLRDKYAIVGIGNTDYTKQSGRTVRSLATEACLKAIADAGLDVSDVDGIVSFNFNDSAPAIGVATEMGIENAGDAAHADDEGGLSRLAPDRRSVQDVRYLPGE
jgi:3-oxoacyl-[acyl-carrier-protein] synthase III